MAAERALARTIVVGWDFSEYGRDAMELGMHVAQLLGTSVAPVRVVAPGEALRREQDVEVPANARIVESSSPARGLHEVADELSAELIVIGPTHHGLFGRIFTGTVADELLELPGCPVAVAPQRYSRRYGNRFTRIVVAAMDFSDESRALVETAAHLARRARGTLEILAVLQPPIPPVGPGAGYAYGDIVDAEEANLKDQVAKLVAGVPAGIVCGGRVVVRGDPAATLLEETEEGVDLLVLGSRGYGAFRRTWRGGVSSKVIRSPSCPVLVLPRRAA